MEYECYLLNPDMELCHMGEKLFETDDLAEACSFVYNWYQEKNVDVCVWQPRTSGYREYYKVGEWPPSAAAPKDQVTAPEPVDADDQIKLDHPRAMWEILVPTEKRQQPGAFYRTRYHRVWDAKVREITGGLTILTPAKGQWVSPKGETFTERMIPVRIVATEPQISEIIDHTLEYYDQLAVLCYKVSDHVIIRHKSEV